jgi:hypothetical protein
MKWTRYPPANDALQRLKSGLLEILDSRLAGLYLYGSLASGDFNPRTSDIDFLAVTEGELPAATIAALEAMHAGILAGGLEMGAKLEGCYLPRLVVRRYNPSDPAYPAINEGRFYLGKQGSDWIIQRHILREQGVVLAGPPPRALIDPVTPAELRASVRAILAEWWAPLLDDPARLGREDYQVYAVLTMCRALYTLRQGEIVSKPAAARWAQVALGERWSGLITAALTWEHDARFDRMDEVRELIRLVLAEE